VYADVLGRPVLVPASKVTGLGSAIFAFLAAGTFPTIEEAQRRVCPEHIVFYPRPAEQKVYDELYGLFRRLYFDFGRRSQETSFGDVLPALIQIARSRAASATG
jgi:L-ribulokinase